MSLKKPSIAAIAHIINEARAQGDAATCDLIANRVIDWFCSQNPHMQHERRPFLTVAGVDRAVDIPKLLQAQQEVEG